MEQAYGEVDIERDRLLVERCQEGDAVAFEDLYRIYYERLYRFCLRRLKNSAEAEDVAQEAFAKAWASMGRPGGGILGHN